ncbi:podocalyxin [Takifugu flavidus]|uniref:Podocalyxin n=1 Tax=Takifugu flavidus TaxID=433684 RepID=A0A5C6ND99_9TELE|nr:podocalyxin [Takifugu flavidus]TWW65026.1 Podocalyxin Podocalyxin-like protein 1 [Takifugu flavidus]
MRGTARITWLLLALALGILDCVWSQDDNPTTASSVSKEASQVISLTTTSTNDSGSAGNTMAVTDQSPTAASTYPLQPSIGGVEKNESTQPPTPARRTDALSPPATGAAATPVPTLHSVPTTLQPATVTGNAAVPLSTTGLDNAAVAAAPSTVATVSSPKDPNLATTTGSIGTLGATIGATIATPSESSTATVIVPGVNISMTTTQVVSTGVPTALHQSSTQNSITSKLTLEDNTRDPVTSANLQLTTKSTGTTGSSGNMGSSSSTSLIKTGSPTIGILATNAGTTLPQTTSTFTSTLGPITSALGPSTSAPRLTTSTITATKTTILDSQPKTFLYSLNKKHEKEEEKDLVEVCRHLMANMHDGNCTVVWQERKGKIHFDYVEINGKVKTQLVAEYYEELTKKPTDNKTLIAILASCGALLIMIVILAVCASHHRKPYGENQQHLTEELQTVENGYHDNPTLEVMEVQPEMQEKKMALNGEFNDSWIVPMDNLMKEDMPDEEDTHL